MRIPWEEIPRGIEARSADVTAGPTTTNPCGVAAKPAGRICWCVLPVGHTGPHYDQRSGEAWTLTDTENERQALCPSPN